MAKVFEIVVKANPDLDDCLTGAAEAYTEEHPDLEGYDLAPRWTDESDRETVTLSIPRWFAADHGMLAELEANDHTDRVRAR